jgi:hypothetical protein
MATTNQAPAYFEAFSNLQNELLEVFGDVTKKADPNGVAKDVFSLQNKLAIATIDNLTAAVKAYRKALE